MAARPVDPQGERATIMVSLRITPTLQDRIRRLRDREALKDQSAAIRVALERGTGDA